MAPSFTCFLSNNKIIFSSIVGFSLYASIVSAGTMGSGIEADSSYSQIWCMTD